MAYNQFSFMSWSAFTWCVFSSQGQKLIKEEHKSYYAISTTYVYGQEKYLLVSSKNSNITWITRFFMAQF